MNKHNNNYMNKHNMSRHMTNKMICVPSEDSDQPGHPPSQIRVFAIHMMITPVYVHSSFRCGIEYQTPTDSDIITPVYVHFSFLYSIEYHAPTDCDVITPVFVHFSFRCGIEYHAPTDCDVIKKWLTKCADDSETANYISANTKDVSRTLNC